jgi:putative two-component system response regulator
MIESSERHAPARILIVDDQPSNVKLLIAMLEREGYANLRSTTESREALALFTDYQPDLILLDLLMPHLDGIQVMRSIRSQVPDGSYLPILMLTADPTPEAVSRALSAGATDFIRKPFDRTEVLLRIRNLLETRLLYRQLEAANDWLGQKVASRTMELRDARKETLVRLALVAERRDDVTGEHLRRVGVLSARVAEAMALPNSEVDLLAEAAPLHDVGKIAIPDGILLKPGKLSPEEFELMKTHAVTGGHILAGSPNPILQTAEEIALCHHERWDGTGYPNGLAHEEIPRSARIVSVADVFDALTHERPYKHAWSLEESVDEITRQSGKQFDASVVRAFLMVCEAGGTEESITDAERPPLSGNDGAVMDAASAAYLA